MTKISIEEQTRVLSAALLTDLRERWRKQYGSMPSRYISRKLMIRALAYEAQVKVHGGLKATARKKLIAIAKGDLPEPLKKVSRAGRPAPGTRLLREWQGRTFIVEVTDGGFHWGDREYSSLSAVAKAITGAKWNGRRFFGLPAGSPAKARPRKEEAA